MARSKIEDRVTAIEGLPRAELIELWTKHYGQPPPLGIRQPMLVRAAAWQLQERLMGGLSVAARRLLKVAVRQVAEKADGHLKSDGVSTDVVETVTLDTEEATDDGLRSIGKARSSPQSGSRLIRDWNGRRYVVEVCAAGYVMDGKSYRSLTAIAYRITGARWSGPRFFGL